MTEYICIIIVFNLTWNCINHLSSSDAIWQLDMVNLGSGKGLLPVLPNYQTCFVAFAWGRFHKKMNLIRNAWSEITILEWLWHFSRANDLMRKSICPGYIYASYAHDPIDSLLNVYIYIYIYTSFTFLASTNSVALWLTKWSKCFIYCPYL